MESQETELRDQLDRLETLGNKWLDQVGNTKTTTMGNATIVIQSGGLFALIIFFVASVTLGISLAMTLGISSRMSKIETKQDEQSQYINAIYMMAPQLKPEDKK